MTAAFCWRCSGETRLVKCRVTIGMPKLDSYMSTDISLCTPCYLDFAAQNVDAERAMQEEDSTTDGPTTALQR